MHVSVYVYVYVDIYVSPSMAISMSMAILSSVSTSPAKPYVYVHARAYADINIYLIDTNPHIITCAFRTCPDVHTFTLFYAHLSTTLDTGSVCIPRFTLCYIQNNSILLVLSPGAEPILLSIDMQVWLWLFVKYDCTCTDGVCCLLLFQTSSQQQGTDLCHTTYFDLLHKKVCASYLTS